ncbi:DUF421 domain-containing protein [Sphingobacterium sp. SG20118]|uniref:DUF421 domain-containing protein n=1 Tax=Sphingobacterium sp. SG20118 TaxID=3367156 RepID=UPI0037DFC365
MIELLIGSGDDINTLQMVLRAIIIFFIALLLIRLGGLRIIGEKSGFDIAVVIMLGAILSRAIVGASPLIDTVMASLAMVSANKLLAWLCTKNKRLDYFMKGRPLLLYAKGKLHRSNMSKANLSQTELMTNLRLETNSENLNEVITAYMEPNGRISFVLKKKV